MTFMSHNFEWRFKVQSSCFTEYMNLQHFHNFEWRFEVQSSCFTEYVNLQHIYQIIALTQLYSTTPQFKKDNNLRNEMQMNCTCIKYENRFSLICCIRVPEEQGRILIQLVKVFDNLSLAQHHESFGNKDPKTANQISK